MARVIRSAWLASFIGCGTLLAHAVTYALEGRSLADGRHAYFAPMLEVVLASAFLGCALIVGRAVASQGASRMNALPPLHRLVIIVASFQTAAFALLEFLEGHAPDALGCAVELFMALLVAIGIALFYRVVERCAQTIISAYALLVSSGPSTRRLPVPFDTVRSLTVCVGMHRFERPPPLLAG